LILALGGAFAGISHRRRRDVDHWLAAGLDP
jgi:hypothetical protein